MSKPFAFRQVAALPYRTGPDGEIEILLVTSRERGRWILPKGWPIKGVRNCDAAATEAREEAGAVGTVAKKPFGSFDYLKRFGKRGEMVSVQVYPLRVETMLDDYDEKGERSLLWLPAEKAAHLATDEGVRAIILQFAAAEAIAAA